MLFNKKYLTQFIFIFFCVFSLFPAYIVKLRALPDIILIFIYFLGVFCIDIKKINKNLISLIILTSPWLLLCLKYGLYFHGEAPKRISLIILYMILPLTSITISYQKINFEIWRNIFFKIYFLGTFFFSCIILFLYYYFYPNHHGDWYLSRMIIENSIDNHGTYMSLIIAIAIIAQIYFLFENIYKSKIEKHLLLFPLIPNILSLIISNSRIVFGTLMMIILVMIFIHLRKKNLIINWKYLGVFILFILVISLSLNLFQRYIQEINGVNNINIYATQRYASSFCAIQIAKQNLILGIDPTIVQEKLNNCYNNYNINESIKLNLNTHNQYLDYLLKGGLILLILFISSLIYKIQLAIKTKNYLLLYFTLLFMVCFFTENILQRQFGSFVYIFIDFTLLPLSLKKVNHNQSE